MLGTACIGLRQVCHCKEALVSHGAGCCLEGYVISSTGPYIRICHNQRVIAGTRQKITQSICGNVLIDPVLLNPFRCIIVIKLDNIPLGTCYRTPGKYCRCRTCNFYLKIRQLVEGRGYSYATAAFTLFIGKYICPAAIYTVVIEPSRKNSRVRVLKSTGR